MSAIPRSVATTIGLLSGSILSRVSANPLATPRDLLDSGTQKYSVSIEMVNIRIARDSESLQDEEGCNKISVDNRKRYILSVVNLRSSAQIQNWWPEGVRC